MTGELADSQAEEQLREEVQDGRTQTANDPAAAQNSAPKPAATAEELQDDGERAPRQTAAAAATSATEGGPMIKGAAERRKAQTVAAPVDDEKRIKAFLKLLTKRAQSKLAYPEASRKAGLKGVATVAFTMLDNGEMRDGSLRIVESSGHAALNASALNALRASFPLPPPSRQLSLAIGIVFGPKSR